MSSPSHFILQNYDSKASEVLIGASTLADRIKAYKGSKSNTLSALNKTNLLHVYSEYRQSIQITSEYTKQQPATKPLWGSSVVFELRDFGHFWSDMVLHVTIDAIGDPSITGNTDVLNANKYFYCDFPGARLVEKTELIIDNNPIDQYNTDDVMFSYNYEIPTHKKRAWERCMGQEQPVDAYIYNENKAIREKRSVLLGAQTPRPYQPKIDLWIPLQFWFNKDIANALSSGVKAGTTSQRFIRFKLAAVTDIIKCINSSNQEIPFATPNITCDLYVNNITINPEVYDIFLDKMYFTIARLHNSSSTIVNKDNNAVWLNQFKYPTEYMYFGFRPLSQKNLFDGWYRYNILNSDYIYVPSVLYLKDSTVPTLYKSRLSYYNNQTNIVDTLAFTIGSGIRLYETMPASFFDTYTPYKPGAITSPNDSGMYYVQFNQSQLDLSISGYLDLSKLRDLRIEYTSRYINTDKPTELVVSSRAINFLVISKTTALRFAS